MIFIFRQKKVVISDSEWLVMQAVWDKSPCYMGDIVNALAYTPWSRTTISTMVIRMISKKLIQVKVINSSLYLYSPLVSEEEAVEIYTKAFIERVYKNDAAKLVESLAEDKEFTKKEKAKIKDSFK